MTKICSSPTKEGLEKLINEYHYSTTFRIEGNQVLNKFGLFERGTVREKKGRFTYYISQ